MDTIRARNPNGRRIIVCKTCKKQEELHAKGMCQKCYKKQYQTQTITCSNCKRDRPHKAFGLCGGCHTRLHHYDKTLAFNARKNHGIDFGIYKSVTKKCASCGFEKIVNIHHLNGDTRDNSPKNIVGLCPNCHKMIHTYSFYNEIKENLRKKKFDVSMVHPTNYVKK